MRLSRHTAIPELEDFDQEELNTNPILNTSKPIPLIGALLIAEGLITREQLNASLLVQEQDHPEMEIGQILIHCGYISKQALEQILATQHHLKSSLSDTIESRTPRHADLTALVLHGRSSELAYSVLNILGVAATPVRNSAEFGVALSGRMYDMILVGADMLNDTTRLPDHGSIPLLILPLISATNGRAFQLPQWARSIIARFVGQVRAQQRQSDMIDRLHQREYELSVVAALSRSIAMANTAHDALVRLMITIRDLFGVEAGTLYRFDRVARQLIFEIVIGPHQETLYQQRLPIDRGIAGWVVRNGEPLLIPNVQCDSRFEGMFDHRSGFHTRSVLCVPLIATGEVCGVIQLINKLNGAFTQHDLQLLRILAAMGALVAVTALPLNEFDLAT